LITIVLVLSRLVQAVAVAVLLVAFPALSPLGSF
jgi:hypothetical protein